MARVGMNRKSFAMPFALVSPPRNIHTALIQHCVVAVAAACLVRNGFPPPPPSRTFLCSFVGAVRRRLSTCSRSSSLSVVVVGGVGGDASGVGVRARELVGGGCLGQPLLPPRRRWRQCNLINFEWDLSDSAFFLDFRGSYVIII